MNSIKKWDNVSNYSQNSRKQKKNTFNRDHRKLQNMLSIAQKQQNESEQKVAQMLRQIQQNLINKFTVISDNDIVNVKADLDNEIKSILQRACAESKIYELQIKIENAKNSISFLSGQIQYHTKMGYDINQLESCEKTIQNLQIQLQNLQNQISNRDVFAHQQNMLVQIQQLEIEYKQLVDKLNYLKESLKAKQLRQQIQKNKLVVELGNYERLVIQKLDKMQQLKSLNRHNEQIADRIAIMEKQKEKSKKNKDQKLKMQFDAAYQNNNQLKNEINRRKTYLNALNDKINNSVQISKLDSAKSELSLLEQQNDALSYKIKQMNSINTQIQKCKTNYQIDRKEKMKKITKKEKKLKSIQALVQNAKADTQRLKQKLVEKQQYVENLRYQLHNPKGIQYLDQQMRSKVNENQNQQNNKKLKYQKWLNLLKTCFIFEKSPCFLIINSGIFILIFLIVLWQFYF